MSNRTYIAVRHPVSAQHASPPVSFLDQLIDAIDPLPDDVFAENAFHDIYAVMKGPLGPYTGLLHRKAVMCEVLRVQAAFESDWNWNEGVDINNLHSMTHIAGEETGAFQVSFDSTALGHSAMLPFAVAHDIDTPQKFISAMKNDHRLAVEYDARLLRINTTWCGTINDPTKAISHVRRDAVAEFQTFLHVGTGTAPAVSPAGPSVGSTGGAAHASGPAAPSSGPVDPRSEGNIMTLHPRVQEDFRDFCRKANAAIAPKVWKWTCGTRTYAEQAELHDAYINHGGPQATSPGNSAHNFAIACDGTLFAADGHTPIWDGPEYTTVGKLGRSLGFHWGADFGDEPHFCKRPPWAESLTELAMMSVLRQRHASGKDVFA